MIPEREEDSHAGKKTQGHIPTGHKEKISSSPSLFTCVSCSSSAQVGSCLHITREGLAILFGRRSVGQATWMGTEISVSHHCPLVDVLAAPGMEEGEGGKREGGRRKGSGKGGPWSRSRRTADVVHIDVTIHMPGIV